MAGSPVASPVLPSARSLALGAYAWVYAVTLGLVLLDTVYSRTLLANSGTADPAEIFNEISDFLLFPYALLILAGAVALMLGGRYLVGLADIPHILFMMFEGGNFTFIDFLIGTYDTGQGVAANFTIQDIAPGDITHPGDAKYGPHFGLS